MSSDECNRYRGGRRMLAYHLIETSCNIDRACEETITCHMATPSYLEGRKPTWDPGPLAIV